MSADASSHLPAATGTALDGLLTALAAPDLPLRVVMSDDGLMFAHITVEVAGRCLEFVAEVDPWSSDEHPQIDQPSLANASIKALMGEGLIGPERYGEEAYDALSRIERSLLWGQQDRVIAEIRAALTS